MTDLTEGVGSSPVSNAAATAQFDKIVDCSAVNLAVTQHDLFDIPAGMLFVTATVEVLTAEGATATADIGITGTLDAVIDGADLNAAAGTVVASGDGTNEIWALQNASAGHYFSAAATLLLDVKNALDTAVFRVKVICIDMRDALNDPA